MTTRKGTKSKRTIVHEVKKKKVKPLTKREIEDFDREFEKALGKYIDQCDYNPMSKP